MKIQVSELLVKFLHRLGVDTLFGMPGAHILPVYDDLYGSGIQTVLVKHEQGAAFMAGGYARVSGRIGACITTAGPGASNLITGIANAYADNDGRTCRDFLASYVNGRSESWMQGAACKAGHGRWEIHTLKPWKRG